MLQEGVDHRYKVEQVLPPSRKGGKAAGPTFFFCARGRPNDRQRKSEAFLARIEEEPDEQNILYYIDFAKLLHPTHYSLTAI
jgi:hypothetical protein